MRILGIESSCDDTSVALIEASDNGFVVRAEKTASQIDVHKKYGGVVPEIAGRMHAEQIVPVIEEVMKDATCPEEGGRNNPPAGGQDTTFEKPDVIAVTAGPGLMTGLLVGTEAAKTLSYLWDVPLVAVNHIEGHICSVLLRLGTSNERRVTRDYGASNNNEPLVTGYSSLAPHLRFPALALIASGGHTELILMRDFGEYELVGKTKDDAAGECFDKAAKLLGFDYPGGPKISKYAETGDSVAIPFPRPMLKSDDFDFSFAGLKTAALYWLRDNSLSPIKVNPLENIFPWLPSFFGTQKTGITINDFCASFEQAIVDVLVTKTIRAAEKHNVQTVILAGGVSANKKLRETLKNELQKHDPTTAYCLSPTAYSMDNGAMIALAAYHHAKKKEFTPWHAIEVDPNWKIYDVRKYEQYEITNVRNSATSS